MLYTKEKQELFCKIYHKRSKGYYMRFIDRRIEEMRGHYLP